MMKAEDPRRHMGDKVGMIPHHGEVLEADFEALFEQPPNDARTAEAVALDKGRDVGTVEHAVFMAQKSDRRAVGISRDDDVSDMFVRDERCDKVYILEFPRVIKNLSDLKRNPSRRNAGACTANDAT